jgi:LPS export ABC transporter protein LptC
MTGRRWVVIGLVVIVVPVVIWALLQAPAPVRQAAPSPTPLATPAARATATPGTANIPPVRVEGSVIATVDSRGRQQWDIRADTVSVDGPRGTVTLTVVTGVFFEDGEPSVEFSAPRGTFFIGSRNVKLEGGVRAKSVTGRTLDAQTATWTPNARQIAASGNVILRQPGMTVRADRLTADTSLQHTKLSGNIRVTVDE